MASPRRMDNSSEGSKLPSLLPSLIKTGNYSFKGGTKMGETIRGPMCSTRCGPGWIDDGTRCLSRSYAPKPSGLSQYKPRSGPNGVQKLYYLVVLLPMWRGQLD